MTNPFNKPANYYRWLTLIRNTSNIGMLFTSYRMYVNNKLILYRKYDFLNVTVQIINKMDYCSS